MRKPPKRTKTNVPPTTTTPTTSLPAADVLLRYPLPEELVIAINTITDQREGLNDYVAAQTAFLAPYFVKLASAENAWFDRVAKELGVAAERIVYHPGGFITLEQEKDQA